MARPSLTRRRLLGLDRSGPDPPETLPSQPLRPWTLPNAVGFIRLGLVPVFLALGLSSGDGREATATVTYAVVTGSDYLDGLLARVTGQYSRLGALLDPLTDRLAVVAATIVAWHFELLPRWALAVLAGRELVMLVLSREFLRRGLELKINMLGRLAVWSTMSAFGLAMIFETPLTDWVLYLGLAMTLAATWLYLQDGLRRLGAPPSTST